VNRELGRVGAEPEKVDKRWWIWEDEEVRDEVRLDVEGWEEPNSGARREGLRPVIPVRREEKVDIKAANWDSVSGDVENLAFSYCETKVSQRERGLIRPNEVRRSRYSWRPQVEGRWRSATIRASGIEPEPEVRFAIWR
jgi:hypothetical protein